MDNIKFRNLDLSLIDKLVLFQKNFFDELNGNVFSKKELIRNLNSKYNCTYICLDQGSIVAFLSAQRILNYCEIHSLFVSPNFRRKGIAMTLLHTLIESCKEKKIDNMKITIFGNGKMGKLIATHSFQSLKFIS